jgi:AcrR family transcriptional regulator
MPAAQPLRIPARRAKIHPVRDAERTREQILGAAAREFADSGLGGARVDQIAAQAGVNVRMLYYYFSSKDDLFLAVLERAYQVIGEAEKGLEIDQAEPMDGVRRLVEFTWRFQLSHPEFIRLLNSENLHQGRHLARSASIGKLRSPLLEMIGRLLERGANAGVFRSDVEPMRFYIMIASLSCFYLSNRYTLSAVFGRNLMTPKERAAHLAFMIEVVLGYLRPGSGGQQAG